MPVLTLLGNLGMGGGTKFVPIPGVPQLPDVSVQNILADDHRMPMLKKSGSVTRLFKRQVKERKRVRLSEEKGKWFDRLVDSNNMRAQLLASTL